MSSPPAYTLGRVPEAARQIKELGAKAKAVGLHLALISALKVIVDSLESTPADFGDPRYKTKRPGGMVYQAIVPPLLSVHYAVYEQERVVMLLSVNPLPRSRLE
jgi:hypothetical protein